MLRKHFFAASAFALGLATAPAFADTISPDFYTADIGVGESVTIEKTVVIEAAGPTDALIDAHFLIDTSGSMGGAINGAKAAANAIFTGLQGFGDAQGGVGVFSEGVFTGGGNNSVVFDPGLTSNATTFSNNVNDVTLSVPDGGGDFPESGYTAIAQAGGDLAWRPGSNRFMFVLTDASSKGSLADAQAALAADDITLIALDFRGGTFVTDSYGAPLGGTVFASSTSAADIVANVTAGISAGFAEYDTVTVDDLGLGAAQGIDVSTVCLTADIGACVGADALGDYDRSVDRTFTFDVTFTRTADGDADFFTNALVDGGIVARERDVFPGAAPIPLPAGLPLMLTAFGGFALLRRRFS